MPVTLIYEPHESPLGTSREAAVYETLEEALFQAAWDEMAGANRFPERIIDGAHHGSSGWQQESLRRGRPRYVGDGHAFNAHDAEGEQLAGEDLILAAVGVVREHFVVHPEDAADEARGPFGSPSVPVEAGDPLDRPSPSVEACLSALRELLAA